MATYVIKRIGSNFYYDKVSSKEYASYSAFQNDAKTWKSKSGAESACRTINKRYGSTQVYVDRI